VPQGIARREEIVVKKSLPPRPATGKGRAVSGKGTTRSKKKAEPDKVDLREQLVNNGEVGEIGEVSIPADMITSLRGIMLDLDPKLLRCKIVPKEIRDKPKEFYDQVVSHWLGRHAVLKKAEVRVSGQGLHLIIRLDKPIVFETEADRQRWSGIVRVIQKILPTDPNCPGITALTRPIGSINSKTDAKVQRLHKGEPVTSDEVVLLYEQVRRSPVPTIATILFGADRTPCPVCEGEGTRLDMLDHVAMCYANCGKVRLSQLFDVFFKPTKKKEG
jgi:hypothetical protein